MPYAFVQTNKGAERVWQRSRVRGTTPVKLKEYDVFLIENGDRVKIGKVGQLLKTFEQRTPGRTYVNKRWQSPRWYSALEDEHLGATRQIYCETRKEAAERLEYQFNRRNERVAS